MPERERVRAVLSKGMSDMEFRQQRFATHLTFNFGETELKYRVKDNSGDAEFEIDYRDIPSRTRTVFERNTWLRNVGFLWCIIGVVEVALAFYNHQLTVFSSFWLPIGAGCLAFYAFSQKTYTAIDTSSGMMVILKDKQHDEILGLVRENRKKAMLSWYRGMDFEGDMQREIQAVEWLKKENVLTKDEADRRIAVLRTEQPLLEAPPADELPCKLH